MCLGVSRDVTEDSYNTACARSLRKWGNAVCLLASSHFRTTFPALPLSVKGLERKRRNNEKTLISNRNTLLFYINLTQVVGLAWGPGARESRAIV